MRRPTVVHSCVLGTAKPGRRSYRPSVPLRLLSRQRPAPADPASVARFVALSLSRPQEATGWTPRAPADGVADGPSPHPGPTPRSAQPTGAEPPQPTRRLPPRPQRAVHHTLPAPVPVRAVEASADGGELEGRQAVLAAVGARTAAPSVPAGLPRGAVSPRLTEPDIAAALRQDLPLDLGLDTRTSVLEKWKAGRTDPGRRGVVALAVVAVLAVALTVFVVLHGRPEAVTAPQVTAVGVPVGQTDAPGPTGNIVVSVGGKVARPGVVTLPAGARVDDAVQAAGGPTDPAAVGLMNLARRLVDGEQVLVGVEPPPGAAAGPAGVPGDGRVDLNSADASGLEQLSGIGPVLAERIVAWREEHGRFTSVDQLREVSGIGQAKFASVKGAVRV